MGQGAILVAPAVAEVRAPATDAPAPARAREVFVAAGARRTSAFTRWRRRLRWPLGIYTTPVVILIVWEILAELGVLGPTYAPAPTAIARTAAQLWRQGVLGPDLAISLRRAAIGLALGLSVGIVTGVIGGLLSSGEHLFNGIVQIFNTIPILAILPVMIVWFGINVTAPTSGPVTHPPAAHLAAFRRVPDPRAGRVRRRHRAT